MNDWNCSLRNTTSFSNPYYVGSGIKSVSPRRIKLISVWDQMEQSSSNYIDFMT